MKNIIRPFTTGTWPLSRWLASCCFACMLAASLPEALLAQQGQADTTETAYVDDHGILRWQGTGNEVCRYGVNYTLPFAHAYRAAGYLGVDRKKAIEQDVYHLARLGLDGFRVHVWDCEISDTLGNLLENEHLDLLDYLMKTMKDRGIKFIITPIAYWGNGYPERDEDTPGFSTKYGKAACLTDPDAIRAQETYLDQFVSHVNPYTGLAYKDEPAIIAFEVCNEPHHSGNAEATTAFINRMADAIKNTGCRKPVFYNTSHSIRLGAAYFASEISGGTYQWYPTGLVAGHEVRGNFLPNTSVYNLPYDTVPGFDRKASIVYEYDAADVGRSYIHPYIAKSFRQAGMQFVAQFAYDPMFMAWANTEYQTHYMNFAYAPQKALSLKIASEVFHRMPVGFETKGYPSDTVFDVFRVSYREDLSEMAGRKKFMYTNNTSTDPPAPGELEEIAGYGTSPVVSYDGCGAYLLDRIENGVWRLEVMPDAVWVRDPFGRASLKQKVSVILWKEHAMKISLPDLGEIFTVTGLNDGNETRSGAKNGSFSISPGTYLLVRSGVKTTAGPDDAWKNIRLGEFTAPPANCEKTSLVHHPVPEATAGSPLRIGATVVSPDPPESVELVTFAGWRPDRISMERTGLYVYSAVIPGERVRAGYLNYYIVVKAEGAYRTFPQDASGQPTDWDFTGREPYRVRIAGPESPVVLFEAAVDADMVYGNAWSMPAPSVEAGETVCLLQARNLNWREHRIASRFFFKDRIRGRTGDLEDKRMLVFSAYSATGETVPVELALVLDDGTAYGTMIRVSPEPGIYRVPLEQLEKVRSMNLPDGYPVFLPFYSRGRFDESFDITKAESVQFSIGRDIHEYDRPYGVAVNRIYLDRGE